MAGLWVNECGNAFDVELSAGVGGVEAWGRGCNDDLRLARRDGRKRSTAVDFENPSY